MSLFAIALLTVVAAALYIRRRVKLYQQRKARVTDDLMRRVEEVGRIDLDEPLDLEEIQREEDQFWEETWDEPDEDAL